MPDDGSLKEHSFDSARAIASQYPVVPAHLAVALGEVDAAAEAKLLEAMDDDNAVLPSEVSPIRFRSFAKRL